MSTPSLKHAKAELFAAESALASMRAAKKFPELEAAWRDFLNHLEKVWVKAERSCEPIRNQFQPWQGSFSRLRKKDMLLSYLKQARDADNHSIQEMLEHEPGLYEVMIRGNTGELITINRMDIDGRGRIAYYSGSHAPKIVDKPPSTEAIPVFNSGRWFNPPTQHMNNSFASKHPIDIAHAGLEFYKNFIEELELTFFASAN